MDTGKKFAQALAICLLFVGHCFAQPNQAPDFTPPAPYKETTKVGIDYSQVRNIYQLVFLYNEILDERELRYVFAQPKEFLSDFNMITRRAKDLEDAPHLWECVILPERHIANELLMFNRAYKRHLEECSTVWFDVHNRNWLHEATAENELLYQLWDCVRDARCEYYYVHIRRQALKKLNQALGPFDAKFTMPPHVPIWRFTCIR